MHFFNRREILTGLGGAFGMLALRGIMGKEAAAAGAPDLDLRKNPLAAQPPHFAPKAKSVIFLFMYGGPSHVDLFDPKPELAKWHGKPIPVWKPEDAFMGRKTQNIAMQSYYRFAKHGAAGIDMA